MKPAGAKQLTGKDQTAFKAALVREWSKKGAGCSHFFAEVPRGQVVQESPQERREGAQVSAAERVRRPLKLSFRSTNPSHGNTTCLKGLILYESGKKEEGRQCCNQGMKFNPTSFFVWDVMARIKVTDAEVLLVAFLSHIFPGNVSSSFFCIFSV